MVKVSVKAFLKVVLFLIVLASFSYLYTIEMEQSRKMAEQLNALQTQCKSVEKIIIVQSPTPTTKPIWHPLPTETPTP